MFTLPNKARVPTPTKRQAFLVLSSELCVQVVSQLLHDRLPREGSMVHVLKFAAKSCNRRTRASGASV